MEGEDLPATQPVDTQIFKDVVAFVDVRTGHNNQSKSIASILQSMGATISTKLNKSVTHMIFKDGGQGNYRKAKRLGVHLQSVLWIESCRHNETKVKEHLFPAQVSEAYDLPVRLRKMKSMQPVDLEEDLARSAARIRRREKAAFRQEIRRRCLELRPDGSNPLSSDYVPFVYEEKHVPDVVLKPSEFDDYKSSSEESGDECVLPLLQRLFMRFPDSPEIKEYIQKHGRSRVRRGTPGSPLALLLASTRKVHDGETSPRGTPRLEFSATPSPRALRSLRRSHCHQPDIVDGSCCSKGDDIDPAPVQEDSDCAQTSVRKSCETSLPESASGSTVGCGLRSSMTRTAHGGDAHTQPRSSEGDTSGVLHEIRNLHIGRQLHNAAKHKSFAAEEDLAAGHGSSAETAKNQVADMPKAKPKKIRGSARRDSWTSCHAATGSLDSEGPVASAKVRAGEKEHANGSFVPLSSAVRHESIAGGASEPEGDSIAAVKDEKPRSRNSLDEFKPVFSSRTRRVLSLDECGSPGEGGNSTSKWTALPNLSTKHIVLTSFTISEKETLVPVVKMLGGFRLSYHVDRCTTHLVTGASRRTVNSLLATLRGCWILNNEWIFKSLEAGAWLDEQPFELADAFPAAKVFRLERSNFGDNNYACNLFGDLGPVALASSNVPEHQLKELLQLAGANVVKDHRKALVIVGQPPSRSDAVCVGEQWVLDSITSHRILPFDGYLVRGSNKRRRSEPSTEPSHE